MYKFEIILLSIPTVYKGTIIIVERQAVLEFLIVMKCSSLKIIPLSIPTVYKGTIIIVERQAVLELSIA